MAPPAPAALPLLALFIFVVTFPSMEIPAKVSVFNRTLEIKGKLGTLVAVNDGGGYYEIILEVQQRNHTILFPIAETVVIFNEAVPSVGADFEVER